MQYVQCRFHDLHFGVNYHDSDVPAGDSPRRRQIIDAIEKTAGSLTALRRASDGALLQTELR
jgi:hypothetical protein